MKGVGYDFEALLFHRDLIDLVSPGLEIPDRPRIVFPDGFRIIRRPFVFDEHNGTLPESVLLDAGIRDDLVEGDDQISFIAGIGDFFRAQTYADA